MTGSPAAGKSTAARRAIVRLAHRLPAALLCLLVAGPVSAADPLAAIRGFCAADGAGSRLTPSSWPAVAGFVDWRLEPAWDRIQVVRGYEIQTPRRIDDRVVAEIQYRVSAEIRPGKVEKKATTEVVTLELHLDPSGAWRVHGPPPVPRVFAYVADLDALAELLEPDDQSYLSASAFAWEEIDGQSRNLPYTETAEIPGAEHLQEVATGEPGDLAVYYAGSQPYHVGVIASDQTVWSATLNAGVVEAPFAAFAGTIRYWRPSTGELRLSDPERKPEETPRRRR